MKKLSFVKNHRILSFWKIQISFIFSQIIKFVKHERFDYFLNVKTNAVINIVNINPLLMSKET